MLVTRKKIMMVLVDRNVKKVTFSYVIIIIMFYIDTHFCTLYILYFLKGTRTIL